MNKSLIRSIGFWLLLILSLAATAVGGWLISGQLGTMTTTLTDGTATGVEVYVGQSLVVVGAAVLGAGIIGILLAVALTAVQALIPTQAPVVVEPIDWAAESAAPDADAHVTVGETVTKPSTDAEATEVERIEDDEDQNGSSGSTATATKINVK